MRNSRIFVYAKQINSSFTNFLSNSFKSLKQFLCGLIKHDLVRTFSDVSGGEYYYVYYCVRCKKVIKVNIRRKNPGN